MCSLNILSGGKHYVSDKILKFRLDWFLFSLYDRSIRLLSLKDRTRIFVKLVLTEQFIGITDTVYRM